MPQPATSTDRLANVIQVIQLGRKTGTLIAERDSRSGLEQGTIYFANGQVVRARAHLLEGSAAFNWLSSWGACRFTFTPSTSPATTVKLPAIHNGHISDPKVNDEEALQRIEQANLSRAHRRLYLLIDGHRNSSELARLMGRSQREIEALMQDLQRAGIIQF